MNNSTENFKSPSQHLRLTKLDVARRQLDLAICLFFDDSDPVSIHTLTEASSQVLHDLGKAAGIANPFRENSLVRPDKRKEWINALLAARNFFKHADKDKDNTFSFNTDLNETSIIAAVSLYQALATHLTPEMDIYTRWYVLKYPDHFIDGSNQRAESDRSRKLGIQATDKAFFRKAIVLARSLPAPK